MEVSEATRLKALEEENPRLKRLVADQALDIQILKEVNSKKVVNPVQKKSSLRPWLAREWAAPTSRLVRLGRTAMWKVSTRACGPSS
jgi:hypothetical protein